jgi:hypothetical protein
MANQKQELPVAAMFGNGSKFILYITSRYSHFNILFSKPCQRQYELLPTLGVRRLSYGFRGEEFKKSANQKQESPVVVMFVNGLGRNEQSL